ncbi:MAG: hypothetical protein GY754_24395 [bacterium]|nr:hypothetical protein [bacterium]
MKNTILIVFLSVFTMAFIGCDPVDGPDLKIIGSPQVVWNAAAKKCKAEVKNVGNKDAGAFMIYANADEDPVSSNHRPQVSKNEAGLAAGASTSIEADFLPLAHADNSNLANVNGCTVIADPKNMVAESNENNNSKTTPIP